ncbi:hypothetical protein FHS19_005787 [Paenibacillus rhizosphaerae]|uniref:Uncharacterized protein n=1 Tax=Paenibacillus rhizosphaerae TaxID=297318 RepID=A0A839U2G9_9BACL|nr:hypothetical protein [Paenibacillus rhizosphaerae]MBB3131067.1 hypothetical protein [Paenibacillus rhizosphaerae]
MEKGQKTLYSICYGIIESIRRSSNETHTSAHGGRDAFGVPAAVEAVFLDEMRRWEHGFKGGT